MNVDWNWIKQRPHFLAEHLQAYHELLIVNQFRYIKKGYQKRIYSDNIFLMRVLPRIDRYKGLSQINIFLKKKIIKKILLKFQPEFLYLTCPGQYEWIPVNYEGKIIYDCMDDHLGLERNKTQRKKIYQNEEKICEKADLLIVSSRYLKEILCKRYGKYILQKANVIRNGYSEDIINCDKLKKTEKHGKKFVICYFGTISYWFDFELILKSLQDFDNIEYLLIGPLHKNMKVIQNKRIRYKGTVEHNMLVEYAFEADCFVMPFILSESIRAVDPVKLYEYISFNRNIICVRYGEVERFSDFAYLYNGYIEYKNILMKLIHNNNLKYTLDMKRNFLKNNTWKNRALEINKLLLEMLENQKNEEI